MKEQKARFAYSLLTEGAFWVINKELAHEIGMNCSILLSDLISKEKYFRERNQLDEDGFFFNTVENIEIDTSFKIDLQKKLLDRLVNFGFVEIEYKGFHKKRFYRINHKNLLLFFTDYETFLSVCPEKTGSCARKKPAVVPGKNRNLNKNKDNKNKEIKLNKERVNPQESKNNSFQLMKEKHNPSEVKKDYSEKLRKEFQSILDAFSANNIKIKLKPGSKTCKQLYEDLKQIQSGAFYSDLRLERFWREKYEIDSALKRFNRPLSIEQLEKMLTRALKRFNDMRTKPEYFKIQGSDKITTTTFLYNSNTQKSYFLQYLLNEPLQSRDVSELIQITQIQKNLDAAGINQNFINSNVYNNDSRVSSFSESEKRTILFTANSILKWYRVKEKELKLCGINYSVKDLFRMIGFWLLTQNKMQAQFLDIQGKSWDWFNDWLKENYGKDLRVNKERVIKARRHQEELEKADREEKINAIITERVQKLKNISEPIPILSELIEWAEKEFNKRADQKDEDDE